MPRAPEIAPAGPVDAAELAALETSLARGATRERLLEILLEVRDAKGGRGISEKGLRHLADRLRLFPAEAYEVATAFPAVNYGASEPYATEACGDLACALRHGTTSGRGVCRNHCDGPRQAPEPRSFAAYRAAGGYGVLDALRDDPDAPARILELIATHHAVGRAGVGFPVAEKWRQVMAAAGTPVIIVNVDEGELAIFKDRFILESDPHGVLEAALVAGRVTGADAIFLYVRDDYAPIHAILRQAMSDVVAAGLTEGIAIELRRSGGAFICGEETALIASLEGRPARPSERPPFPTERGYLGRPTVLHNAETYFRLRAAWGAAPDPAVPVSGLLDPQAAVFSVSGRVRAPGPKLAHGLARLEDLVELAGGMAAGARLGGMVVAGSSGTLVAAADCRRPLADLLAEGLRLGTRGIIVFGADDDKRAIAARMAAYLARESCGQCGPCRVGTAKAAHVLAAPEPLDMSILGDLSTVMGEASLCALGRNAGRFLGGLSSSLAPSNP
ncbi:NADH-ubiquinone oxidoreductase-F iron-sulfur binding region domain-containing protein [Xanthobacter autotrophicus DSM 597]|uniref:NADH-ubiquinone oxidoreductase-F iron-sulfur binding region domain-containing protein n=1 Tax=Xanthobacter wiegelii TaxID=3119913 RepID=UPI00372713F6